ncbi:TPA: glycoside hydrolase family 3 protein [Enterobacter cloacae]|nr:glycoside hydrolase family 3 C-terminal domain-containing protein [Enterobacter cloacae]MCL8316430.1 glycoside hydrolase family 3 C-terminal domain-containing protein [Enterobacter cloacae subsp. cloacae]HDC4293646.1 glycoside hydrolase family 3 protein [Enterobacter cloacae]HDC4353162.1 glycoside hydrolase family 3 protein [Enterobacter cloacae]
MGRKFFLIFLFTCCFFSIVVVVNKHKNEPSIEDKVKLLSTSFGFPILHYAKPVGALNSAGFNAGLPEFGIEPLQEVDSGMGIASPGNFRKGDNVTALPSTLLVAATFCKKCALEAGDILGMEAKDKGFNIVLAGGVNLIREPRNGRNFEYSGEDPLLSGVMTGSFVEGIQKNNLVSTIKHFAFNSQENGRVVLNALINEKNARESDLLAFEIANEVGKPGAVMTSYNKVNGDYASENSFLINTVLKGDWKFKGWVMSDWGGTHSTDKAVLAGLDQQSGFEYDHVHYYGAELLESVRSKRISKDRIDDMYSRIVGTLISHNAFKPSKSLDSTNYYNHRKKIQTISEKGMVLLKNDSILPLKNDAKKILVIGGNADKGVLSGAGASQVIPEGSYLIKTSQGTEVYHPVGIVQALKEKFSHADVEYDTGVDISLIRKKIIESDTVIIFANQWSKETRDHTSLNLPNNQDSLISTVSELNRNVIVVLQTGGPVVMPWLDSVKAVLESWYSGVNGGKAIVNILAGEINPSGRLPVSFPQKIEDLPHPIQKEWSTTTSSPYIPKKGYFNIDYNIEGADVGYKWFLKRGARMLFPFGYGLSYTQFRYRNFQVFFNEKNLFHISVDIINVGTVKGVDTPQIYIRSPSGKYALVAWEQIELPPGKSKKVYFKMEPRSVAEYNVSKRQWVLSNGKYDICISKFAGDCVSKVSLELEEKVVNQY